MRFCFITGHRPNRFKFPENYPRCDKIKSAIRSEIIRLYEQDGIRGVWVGGAAGVDTWAAEIVLELQQQKQYHDLNSMLPSLSRSSGILCSATKERYQRILNECADSVVVCKSYRQDAYKRRDYYMVDRSVCGIAVYDLDKSIRSGTGMTYNYAVLKKKLPVTVIHPDTDSIIK